MKNETKNTAEIKTRIEALKSLILNLYSKPFYTKISQLDKILEEAMQKRIIFFEKEFSEAGSLKNQYKVVIEEVHQIRGRARQVSLGRFDINNLIILRYDSMVNYIEILYDGLIDSMANLLD